MGIAKDVEDVKNDIRLLGYHTPSQIKQHITMKLAGRAKWEIDKISQQVLEELEKEKYL